MIAVTHLDRSRSERILWLLEELGLPYRVERFERQPDLYAPAAMKAAHPLGRAPVIRDGAVVLAESGAIVEYILARYGGGRLAPAPETAAFPRYLHWLHYAEGSLMLQLLREWSVERLVGPAAEDTPALAQLRAHTRLHLDHVEAALAENPYVAGPDFTAADIMMAYPFTTFRTLVRPLDLSPYPAIRAWVGRIGARPAFRKAVGPS